LLHVCSDAPVRCGSIRHLQRDADAGDRTKWQLPARASIVKQQLKKNKRTEKRTLNPRVRASLRRLASRLVGIAHGCLKTRTLYDEATAWNTGKTSHKLP
jgi:hypothetical protein